MGTTTAIMIIIIIFRFVKHHMQSYRGADADNDDMLHSKLEINFMVK